MLNIALPLFIFTVVSTSFLFYQIFGPNNLSQAQYTVLILICLTTFVGSIVTGILTYLAVPVRRFSSKDQDNLELKDLRINLNTWLKKNQLLSDEAKLELKNQIVNNINNETTKEYLDELTKQIKDSEYRSDIYDRRLATLKRVYEQSDNLIKRGNVNLGLGITAAILGVVILMYFVLVDRVQADSIPSFIISSLPRLTIVIIVESFSFFFLRVYRSTLNEIKYFQNEATSIEHRFVALETAIQLNKKDLIESCVNTFINLERNLILTTGQTTQEILKEKDNIDDLRLSPSYLIDLIDAINKTPNISTQDKDLFEKT